MLPIYWIVITSFKTQSNYFAANPLAPPSQPTLENYRLVIESRLHHGTSSTASSSPSAPSSRPC